ncbi:Uncharacterized protein QTN25_005831 [Entamoeba marina]
MLSGVPGHKERIEKGLDSVIKYRRTTSRFKQQKVPVEMVEKIMGFAHEFSNDEISIKLMESEDLNEHNMPNKICKTSQAIVVSSSSNNKRKCIDVLNKIELFCVSHQIATLWSDELKNSLIEKNNAPVATYCLSIGLSLQHFIRYPPRPAPTVL